MNGSSSVLQMGFCDEETPEHPPAGKTRNRTTKREVSRSRRTAFVSKKQEFTALNESWPQPHPSGSVCRHILTDDPHDPCCKPLGKIVGTNYSKFSSCL